MAILLDSNIWIAFLYKKDPNHKKAEKIFEELKKRIILPEYIILEVATILSQKIRKQASNDFIKNVANNQDIGIIPSSREFLMEVMNFYLSKKNEKLSFVDYSLLFLSQKVNVLTFDRNLQKEIKKLASK